MFCVAMFLLTLSYISDASRVGVIFLAMITTTMWAFHYFCSSKETASMKLFLILSSVIPASELDSLCGDTIIMAPFVEHSRATEIIPLERMAPDAFPLWILLLLAFLLVVLVVDKSVYPRQFRQILSVPAGVSATNQLLREWTPWRSWVGTTILLSHLLIVTLFFMRGVCVLTDGVLPMEDFSSFVVVLASFAGWILLRYCGIALVGWLFKNKDMVVRQLAVHISLSAIMVILLVPFVLVLLYNPYTTMVWIGVSIIALLMVVRIWNEMVEIKVVSKYPMFYIFFYLCTLEIIPIMVVSKLGYLFLSGMGISLI